MGMAIGDPEKIRNFAGILENYLSTLDDETGRLNASFQELGETWQDQQRQSFEEKYHELLNALASFKDNASEQIPHLRIMADDLERYLRR